MSALRFAADAYRRNPVPCRAGYVAFCALASLIAYDVVTGALVLS